TQHRIRPTKEQGEGRAVPESEAFQKGVSPVGLETTVTVALLPRPRSFNHRLVATAVSDAPAPYGLRSCPSHQGSARTGYIVNVRPPVDLDHGPGGQRDRNRAPRRHGGSKAPVVPVAAWNRVVHVVG